MTYFDRKTIVEYFISLVLVLNLGLEYLRLLWESLVSFKNSEALWDRSRWNGMKEDSTAPSVPFLRTSDRHSGYGRVKGGVGTHLPRPQSDHEASLPASLLSSCMLSKVMGVSKTWVPAYGGHKVTTRLHCRGQHPLVKHTKSFGRSASRGISQPRFNLRKIFFFDSTLEILI